MDTGTGNINSLVSGKEFEDNVATDILVVHNRIVGEKDREIERLLDLLERASHYMSDDCIVSTEHFKKYDAVRNEVEQALAKEG